MQDSSLFDTLVKQDEQGVPATAYLLEVTKAHPYFTAAQFYLLQQMKKEAANYAIQAAKTALLFNNPYWLQYQLNYPTNSKVKETPVISMFTCTDDSDVSISIKESIATISSESINQTDEPIEPAEDDAAPMPDLKIDLAASIKQAENENALNFEPMHLVDYFASQGIKLSGEIQTADKLGKQLKSFTEWLKTMKKVHVAEAEIGSVQADITIQSLAEKSNTEGEIVTEAMAEVFAQQGKANKAIEVYKKLSLLNPLKSAFFAAKIEQLKGL